MLFKQKKDNAAGHGNRQNGAIIVEATISLSIFMFVMFTMLSVIQIAYTQSRMSVALTCATKEMAEYAHIYYATSTDKALSGTGGKSSEIFGEVGEFLQTIGSQLGSIDSELGQYVSDGGGALSATSITNLATNGIGQALATQLMEKNLVADDIDSAEAFFARNHISDLDLSESKFLENGSPEIFMRAKYKIKVVELLDIDFSFQMSSWAYARAWDGVEVNADG